MSRPRFSEMLIERRRQLGLTIEQASRVLKLKESVLLAFEDGDFPSIPKSGYAQGMLASYARYLGLNPREIVDQFQEDLYEHSNNGVSSHELRRRTRESRGGFADPTYELPVRGRSNNPRLPETQHLLPDNPQLGRTDAYDTTSRARSRSQTWRQSSPLVSNSGHSRDYPQGRPYNAQGAYDAYSRQRSRQARTQAQGQARGQLGDGGDVRTRRYDAAYGSGYGYRRDDVVRQDVSSRQYDDDLRVNNDARPYQAASTRQGRKSYRSIASTERPRVQRRTNDAGRRQLQSRGSRRQPQRQGFMGFVENYFSDSRRTIVTVLVALVVVLVLIISLSVRSCARAVAPQTHDVAVSSVATSAASSPAASSQASSSTAAATTPATTEEPVTEVSVTVKVAEGAVTWVEIDNGGKSEVAETITGPWERTYSVNQAMSIQVADTSAVTVTKNGQTVKFDERSSGVGTISIEGPKVSAKTSATSDAAADGGSGSGDAEGSDTSNE